MASCIMSASEALADTFPVARIWRVVSPVPFSACTVIIANAPSDTAPAATRAPSFTPRGRSDQSECAIESLHGTGRPVESHRCPVLRSLTGATTAETLNFETFGRDSPGRSTDRQLGHQVADPIAFDDDLPGSRSVQFDDQLPRGTALDLDLAGHAAARILQLEDPRTVRTVGQRE